MAKAKNTKSSKTGRGKSGGGSGRSGNGKGSARNLVIVESPAKARTIEKYLGRDYEVAASVGHVRDLPKKELGVDVDGDFEPKYVTIRGKGKVIEDLKKRARNAEAVYLATDPDREGEAIAYHVAEQLGFERDPDRFRRVEFREITKGAVEQAMEVPGGLDMKKVEAQQARRVLDRLVGYQVSPFLWKPIYPGLSAGRVQTVALRVICEREDEIQAFKPEEYWSLSAELAKPEDEGGAGEPPKVILREVGEERSEDGEEDAEEDENTVRARLHRIQGEEFKLSSQDEAREVIEDVREVPFQVTEVKRRERRRNPAAPFTTSTLQQEAARRLRFSARRTMISAQRLYEGADLGPEGTVGLITYMRTDSTRVSGEAVAGAREWIGGEFGEDYVGPGSQGKSAKGAQEAHEAVRPTRVDLHPDSVRRYLDEDDARLYELIWLRFVASQMAPAVYDTTTVDLELEGRSGRSYLFRTTGSVLKFAGFTRLYTEAVETDQRAPLDDLQPLPHLEEGERLDLRELEGRQHFTQPPPRYTEASLVKELEQQGIGRPSTYAQIISTIRERGYVDLTKGRFHPTALGDTVAKLLVKVFPDIFDVEFTSRMEGELDRVEEGEVEWRALLKGFYPTLQERLEEGKKSSDRIVKEILAAEGETCGECGSPMVVRWNRAGRFLGCSAYPECRHTRPVDGEEEDLPDLQGEACPECGSDLAIRRGRYGPFVACTGYPECRYTRPVEGEKETETPKETDEKCDKCGSPLAVKKGKFGEFLACTGYPECKNTKPLTIPGLTCPECEKGGIAVKQTRRGRRFWGCDRYPDCDWSTWDRPVPDPCPSCENPFVLEKSTKAKGEFLQCPSCKGEFEPREEEAAEARS